VALVNDLIEPDAFNTGTSGSLTVKTGDLVVTAATTYVNCDFFGWVDVKAPNVTFINCRFRGGKPRSSSTGLLNCYDLRVINLRVLYCTFAPDYPDHNVTGIMGHDFIIEHCNIFNCVDGVGVYNAAAPNTDLNVTIYRNYIHHMSYFSPDPNHSDNRTHNDCIQIQGGWGIVVKENSLRAYYAPRVGTGTQPYNQASISCLMLNNNVGKLANLVVEDNWFRGGAMPLNAGGLTRDPQYPDLGRFWRNRFTRDAGYPTWLISMDTTYQGYADFGTGAAQNFYMDDGSIVLPRYA
jgi:hypothetical protein